MNALVAPALKQCRKSAQNDTRYSLELQLIAAEFADRRAARRTKLSPLSSSSKNTELKFYVAVTHFFFKLVMDILT